MGGRDDEWYYEHEAATEAFLNDSIRSMSEDSIRSYLGRNGDAIDARVQNCLKQARELKDAGYFQSAHVLAVTAIELIVRFLLVRPLLQGAFLSDEWAYFITQRVASGRSAEDRRLLPQILRVRGIDINSVLLANGRQLWETIVGEVYPKRDRIVHRAEPTTADEAQAAIECAAKLYSDIVLSIAKNLGFSFEVTGCWGVIEGASPDGTHTWATNFVVSDPF